MATLNQLRIVTPAINQAIQETDENLSPRDVSVLANQFKLQVPAEQLNTADFNDIVNYVSNQVPNTQLRSTLLETLNQTKGIKRRAMFGVQLPTPVTRDVTIQSIRTPSGEAKLSVDVPSQEFLNIRRDIDDEKKTFDGEINRVSAFRRPSDINRGLVNAAINTQQNLDVIFNGLAANTNATERRIFNANTGQLASQLTTPRQKIAAVLRNITSLRNIINRLDRSGLATKIRIADKAATLPERLPNTKQNLKRFTESLRREIKKIESKDRLFVEKLGKEFKRGFAVHMPQQIHNIGSIKILANNVEHVKEIIIEPYTNPEDIIKLSHALMREVGVLLMLDGTDVFDINKPNDTEEQIKLAEKIIELLKKQPQNSALRLVYKPVVKFGGQFVGGAFTDAIYNKQSNRELLFNQLIKANRNGRGIDLLPRHNFSDSFIFLKRPIHVI